MPPPTPTPPQMALPATVVVAELPPTDEEIAASFFDLAHIGSAIRANEFSVQEEVTRLIRLLRDPDPAVSLAAHRAYRMVLKEAANAQARHELVRTRVDDSGAVIRERLSTSRLLNSLSNSSSSQPRAEPTRIPAVRPMPGDGAPRPDPPVEMGPPGPVPSGPPDDPGPRVP